MNENHAKLCSSPEWAEWIQTELLPSLADGVELGSKMLEVGPGPGATTDWLRHKVARLVSLEIDPEASAALSSRLAGSNVEVVTGDASAMDFGEASFDSVGCFTMLHHVPTLGAQAKVLSEMFRVLRPGGVLLASDGLANSESGAFHAGDTYNPIEPESLLLLTQALGFSRLTLVLDSRLSLVAHKPASVGEEEPTSLLSRTAPSLTAAAQ